MASLTSEQQRVAKLALTKGLYQHQIAAHFGINQGRISEFKRSETYKVVEPAPHLPTGLTPTPTS